MVQSMALHQGGCMGETRSPGGLGVDSCCPVLLRWPEQGRGALGLFWQQSFHLHVLKSLCRISLPPPVPENSAFCQWTGVGIVQICLCQKKKFGSFMFSLCDFGAGSATDTLILLLLLASCCK